MIEKLKLEDLESYKNLIDECFDGSNDIEKYKEGFKEKDPNLHIYVIKEDNKVIGSASIYEINLFTFSFQPCLEVFNVAVLKDYRKREVAKKLLNYILDYARENNFKSINLTCLDTAYNAHKLYESVGFNKMSSLKYSINI